MCEVFYAIIFTTYSHASSVSRIVYCGCELATGSSQRVYSLALLINRLGNNPFECHVAPATRFSLFPCPKPALKFRRSSFSKCPTAYAPLSPQVMSRVSRLRSPTCAERLCNPTRAHSKATRLRESSVNAHRNQIYADSQKGLLESSPRNKERRLCTRYPSNHGPLATVSADCW